MVYSQKLVACIKVDGQILREDRDAVTIPFGSEYSLYLKNLNSVRVQIKVSVDGQDATEGTWLIIQPNSSIELERFIKNGNLSRGNRFKFIERTGKIEKHRGIGGEDGLIRVEYQTEKVLPQPIHIPVVHYDYYARPYTWWPTHLPWGSPYVYGGVRYVGNRELGDFVDTIGNSGLISKTTTSGNLGGGTFLGNMNVNNVSFSSSASVPGMDSARFTKSSPTRSLRASGPSGSSRSMKAMSMMRSVKAEEANDAGITVAGSESSQQFQWASSFPVHETSDVIVLKLRGSVGGQKVVKAVTVKTKPICATCGKKNRPTVKFCAECGTSLVLI